MRGFRFGRKKGVYPEERSDEGPEVYLVERLVCNEEVGGSIPPRSTSPHRFQGNGGLSASTTSTFLPRRRGQLYSGRDKNILEFAL